MLQAKGVIIIEGHVQGLANTRALGGAGIPVYVIDKTNCIAQHSRYCKKFFKSPDFIKDEFADFLIELAKEEKIKDWSLIPSNDHAVFTIAKHKSALETYYNIISPGFDIIDLIYDKSKLISLAKICNVPIPETHYFPKSDGSIPVDLVFPLITKGRNGLSFYQTIHKKVLLANNQDELREQLNIIDKKFAVNQTFTQEVIPSDGRNKTVSFTAFCIDGVIRSYWMGVKLREHPLRFGTATCAMSVNIEECYLQSIPLLKALKYTGVCEVEYLLDPRDKKYKLIEINARTWLWVGLAKACGVNYAQMIYDYSNGIEMIFPENFQTGKYWINPITDAFYSFLALLKGRLNIKSYFQSLTSRGLTNALFVRGDMKPGFYYMFNIFFFLRKR